MLGVFGDEALRRRAEAEIDHAAEKQHPGPGIDVDAEFKTAHPARQQDLRDKGDQRADDTDEIARTRSTAPPMSARQEVRQSGRGTGSEPIDAKTTSAPPQAAPWASVHG